MSQLINREQLLELVGDDVETFLPIVDDFADNGKTLIATMQASIEAEQLTELKSAAHQLKGSSGMLGMEKLYQMCKLVEEAEIAQLDTTFIYDLNNVFSASLHAAKDALSGLAE